MRRLTPVAFIACLVPVALLVWNGFTGGLTADPIEYITHRTGDWTLRFLLITLAVTPVRRLTGWHSVIRLRRMLGLFAFFYGSLHFLTFLVFDHFFSIPSIVDDIAERKYVTAGFTGFVLMIPLALTSTQTMIRRLGGRRWRALHRLVYASSVAGVVHYLWLVKVDVWPPLRYAAVLAALLGFRVWHHYRAAARAPSPAPLAPNP